MWVRRSHEEIREAKRFHRADRSHHRDALWIAVGLPLAAIASSDPWKPASLEGVSHWTLAGVLFTLIASAILAAVFLIGRLCIYGVGEPRNQTICTACFSRFVETKKKRTTCDCGRTLEPFVNWKWMDEPDT